MGFRIFLAFLFVAGLSGLMIGCANILPPSGGAKDTIAPRLLRIQPADSATNIRPREIELRFDEYLTLSDAATQIQISPLLPQNLSAEVDLRRVTLTLPDTLLQANTTYRISFGTAIRDLHEGNAFPDYQYTFSTGPYFDSLRLSGRVLDAKTGMPDTAVQVLLYDAATATDSIVVSRKPLYVAQVDARGHFRFQGLPNRPFRAFALGDKNTNLLFDNAEERIAFSTEKYTPTTGDTPTIVLYSFVENDSASTKTTSEIPTEKAVFGGRHNGNEKAALTYSVLVDTGNLRKRTGDITAPLKITFSERIAAINAARIFLSRDSVQLTIEVASNPAMDAKDSAALLLNVHWVPDAVYTLRLLKGFVQDVQKRDAGPGKWIFRTKNDDDYAVLGINLPGKYRTGNYVLEVLHDAKTTMYQKPVTDTGVRLRRLKPGTYTLRLLDDRNRNGHWDAGNLLRGEAPEKVIPLDHTIQLKAGWENVVDWKE